MADDEPLDADALYRAHVHDVGRWVARLGGPGIDLQDTVHEVFAVACACLRSFRGRSTVATWLFGITDMVIRHRRRKERWRRWLSASADRILGRVPAPGPDPARAAEQSQISACVYHVLDQLSDGDRRLLILFELEEMSAEEVGGVLAIKPATARVRLHRARMRFMRIYARDYRADPTMAEIAKASPERYGHANQ